MTHAITLNDIHAAAKRISPHAHRTPIQTCATIDAMARRSLFFKCENLQKVGAFKFRGACNAVMQLNDGEASRGVVTHSSGNHAQALALAAKLRGISAHIVMPRNASAVKLQAVKDYGGNVRQCDTTLKDRLATVESLQSETGAVLIPPYDHPHIMAGQGTAAVELLEQVDGLDCIVAPVGGGGLLSGVAVAAKAIKPGIVVIGAEPALADDAARSKQAGQIIPQGPSDTIADGLLTSLGEHTWPIIRDLVDQVVTVTEAQIIAAMRLAWQRGKLLIEPSSAVALAAVLTEGFQAAAGDSMDRVAVILSGGNVDIDRLPW